MMINGRRTLSWHAVFLMTLTPILTVTAILGVFTSRGPYGGLSDTPMAVIGLAQAYPLMGLVAVAMWMGARGPTPRRFSRLAIAAHCIPLAVLAIFWVPIIQSSIAPALPLSFLIHGGGILAEALSLRSGYDSAFARLQ
jgi:hypothetical protein